MANDVKTADDRKPSVSASELDRINLVQALRDFEVANARVIDLTARLTETHQLLINTQNELSSTRLQVSSQAEVVAVQNSRSYRLARIMSKIAHRILR
jgi:hypothetical protein